MIRYLEAIERLPGEIKHPILEAFELFRDEIQDTVKRQDFNELKGIVKELASAQKRTEARVSELASAQTESEKRLTKLEITVLELTEAQKRTEARVEELAIAQKRTEEELRALSEEVRALSEDVRALSEDVRTLTQSHKTLAKQVGGISDTIGFRLEDEAFVSLPELLKKEFGIILKDRLKRRWIKDKEGEYIEVNIVGEGQRDGKKIIIIGEAKSQLSKKDVDEFIRKKLKRLNYKAIFPLLITYMIQQPDVEEYAKEKGIALYYSYDFNSGGKR
ncbi:MAG: hypothetical protein AB1297_07095 [bacterium]